MLEDSKQDAFLRIVQQQLNTMQMFVDLQRRATGHIERVVGILEREETRGQGDRALQEKDLRDRLAMAALQGMLQGYTVVGGLDSTARVAEGTAETAYVYADAMLKAREAPCKT